MQNFIMAINSIILFAVLIIHLNFSKLVIHIKQVIDNKDCKLYIIITAINLHFMMKTINIHVSLK